MDFVLSRNCGGIAYGRAVAQVSGDGFDGLVHRLGERPIYCGAELRVAEVDLRLPGGDRLPWDVVWLARRASVVLANDDRVLLVWRYRIAADRWGWELPGGLVDDDEDPSVTVARELEELAGYRAGYLAPVVSFQPEPHSVDGEHAIFAGRDPEPIANARPLTGDVRCEWLPTRSVPALIAAGDIWAAGTLIGLLATGASGRPGASCRTTESGRKHGP